MSDHVVELNIAEWRGIYPQYPDVSDAQLQGLWAVACDLIGNAPTSRIPYDPPAIIKRKTILYAALCHLAYLSTRGDLVGNVASAAEGTVNAGLAYMQRGNSRWWDQSQCGATVWMLLTPYRSGGCYVPGR